MIVIVRAKCTFAQVQRRPVAWTALAICKKRFRSCCGCGWATHLAQLRMKATPHRRALLLENRDTPHQSHTHTEARTVSIPIAGLQSLRRTPQTGCANNDGLLPVTASQLPSQVPEMSPECFGYTSPGELVLNGRLDSAANEHLKTQLRHFAINFTDPMFGGIAL